MDIIYQPKGAATTHLEGSIIIQSPLATGWGEVNYTITGYPISIEGVPTGDINVSYSGRFDDPRYYTGDTPS